MPSLMPRCTECVLCGEPIKGKGRIDRIYCSASCRTLAWRARAGHRFDGRRKPKLPPQPGDFIARNALPLLAVRMRAELDAAKRRIAELEERLADQRDDSEPITANVGVGAAVAVGAIGIAAALRRRRRRSQQPQREPARDEVEAERQRHQDELTAEQERAARREAKLQEQITALMARAEQAEAREQAAVADLSILRQEVAALRHELNQNENSVRKVHLDMATLQGALLEARKQGDRHRDALLEESRQRRSLQAQLNEARRHLGVQRQELEATDAKLTEELRQRQRLQQQLTTVRRQLGAERREWHAARALLVQHAREEQSHLVADNHQLRCLVAEMESPTRVAAGAIVERQHEAGRNEQKQRPEEHPQNQLPAVSGVAVQSFLTTLSTLKSAAVGARLRDGESQRLPSKDVGSYFEDALVPDRKRLPPRRG